jgi:nicotinate-nucleotide adenylyltransferase
MTSSKKIGLYFGTFNPVHVGHLAIANHMVEFSDLDQVWMVVTPHNPHKKKSTLLDNNHRKMMVDIALEEYPNIKSSAIEFDLPQPNFTVNTLAVLEEKYPKQKFCLLMGEDNLKSFHKWKNFEVILSRYELFVYPRLTPNKATALLENHPNVTRVAAPIMEISSTAIRKAIKSKKNVRPLLPQNVWQYLDEMNFYK